MEVIIHSHILILTQPKSLLSQLVHSIDAAVIAANVVVNLVAIVDSNVSLIINSLDKCLRMTLIIRITIVKTMMMRTTTMRTILTMIMTMTMKATTRSNRIRNKLRVATLNMKHLPISNSIGASIQQVPINYHRTILKISRHLLWQKCCTMRLTKNTMMTFSRINVIICLIGSRCEPSSLTLNTSIRLSRSLCTTNVAIGVKLTSSIQKMVKFKTNILSSLLVTKEKSTVTTKSLQIEAILTSVVKMI